MHIDNKLKYLYNRLTQFIFRMQFPTFLRSRSESYYIRHPYRVRENLRFLSTGMKFSKKEYAYVLKAPSRNYIHIRFFCSFHCLAEMHLNKSK